MPQEEEEEEEEENEGPGGAGREGEDVEGGVPGEVGGTRAIRTQYPILEFSVSVLPCVCRIAVCFAARCVS